MTMRPTRRVDPADSSRRVSRPVNYSTLKRSVENGAGDWSSVPVCVREAIAELLKSTSTSGAAKVRGSSNTTATSDSSILGGRYGTPSSSKKRATSPRTRGTHRPFLPVGGILPLHHLADDALLMSVRTFDDAEELREHAVRNTALFHNNVEQLSKDARLCLAPELRAAIQLHPLALRELKARHLGGDTPSAGAYVSHASSQRMKFEGLLLDDLLDALHNLRKASVRFTANFFTDAEKEMLGIDPAVLPRDETASVSSRTARAVNRSRSDASVAADDDVTLVEEQREFATTTVERPVGFYNSSAPTSGAASANQSLDAIRVAEEDEPEGDRSPRRCRGEPSEHVSQAPLPSVPTHRHGQLASTEDESEPKVSPHSIPLRPRYSPRGGLPVSPPAAVGVVPRHTPLRNTPTRVLETDLRGEDAAIDLSVPPPMPTRDAATYMQHPGVALGAILRNSPDAVRGTAAANDTSATRRHLLPPTSPLARIVYEGEVSPKSPPTLEGSDEERSHSERGPITVPQPGTPRTRNDYVIHPTPRGISVKKKTLLVPRSASQDRDSVRSLSPSVNASHNASATVSPTNSSRRKVHTPSW